MDIGGLTLFNNQITSQSGSVGLDLSYIRMNSGTIVGATNTNVARYQGLQASGGVDITYIPSVSLGDSFRVNSDGIYSISVHTTSTAGCNPEICISSSISNTVDDYNIIVARDLTFVGNHGAFSWSGFIAKNKLVFIHTQNNADTNSLITIVRLR